MSSLCLLTRIKNPSNKLLQHIENTRNYCNDVILTSSSVHLRKKSVNKKIPLLKEQRVEDSSGSLNNLRPYETKNNIQSYNFNKERSNKSYNFNKSSYNFSKKQQIILELNNTKRSNKKENQKPLINKKEKDIFIRTLRGDEYFKTDKKPLIIETKSNDDKKNWKQETTGQHSLGLKKSDKPFRNLRDQVFEDPFDENDEKIQKPSKYAFKINYPIDEDPIYKTTIEKKDTMKEVKEKTNTQTGEKDNKIAEPDISNLSFQLQTGNYTISRYKEILTPQGKISLNLSDDEFNIDEFSKEFNLSVSRPLDECTENISDFGPNTNPTFNFAAYANKSPLIQELLKLGVRLYELETNDDYMRTLMSLDIDKNLKPYLQFLHDCGVPADSLGDTITKCPLFFKEDLDDLKTRIRYLRAHQFTRKDIATIITENPMWLVWDTKKIDERLGHFQNEFKLSGDDVRFLAVKAPRLITYNILKIHENTFSVREEMGFGQLETKIILLSKPRIWMTQRKLIVESFDYLHRTMKIPHILLIQQPEAITTRPRRIKDRHEFLVELKKDQYDPEKPNYISLASLTQGSDAEFCRDVAKTSIETFNLFLKTR